MTDARGETVSYAYDTLKRLTETSAPLGSLTRKTETVYGPDDRVREVKHNTTGSVCDVVYTFTYDEGGRQKEVKVGNRKLSEQFYNPDGTLEKTVFGNSTSARPQEVRYRYDGYKRLQGIRYDGAAEDQITYDIDARGLTVRVTDHTKDHTLITEYDAADRPEWSAQRMGGTHLYTVTLSYDSHGNISAVQERAGNDSTFYETLLTWNADNRPVKVEYDRINSSRISYSYDPLGRLTKRTLKLPGRSYETSYTYIPSTFGTGNTTGLVRTITQAGKTLTYSYDACGNITQVKTGALYTKYSYDKLGRLTRVNDQTDLTADPTGTTWVYTYDLGGNIKRKKVFAYTTASVSGVTPLVTHTLTYSATAWKDKVTKVNGVSITYDSIGNPLNDGAWAYTWEHGRQLRQMAKTDNTETILYEYNASGLRTKKTVTDTGSNSTTETEYILHGKNIVHMTQGSHTLHFLYDGQGKPGIISYDGTQYGYLYNLQGDVIALVDAAGTKVVEYTYDAWGRPTSKTGILAGTLGTIQPFRYRGYVYDEETGLYYLRSRYYNPVWCRFLNADAVFDGTNLFAYCGNNPINNVDKNGLYSINNTILILAFLLAIKVSNEIIKSIGAEIQLLINRDKAKKVYHKIWSEQMRNVPIYAFSNQAGNAAVYASTQTTTWFYNQVNHGAPMDYKRKNRRPWWGLGQDYFYFRGKRISFEQYGNINYGYVGKSLYFSDEVLFAGGGFAAITGHGDIGSLSTYFDSQEDHDYISWGIEIYRDMWGND